MLSPDAALQRLQDGNARYVHGESLHPHTKAETRQALVKGQTPFAAILGCADSRSVPELVFDTGIGELFVVRVAGNVANAENTGSLEYAVKHLGVQLIVVMGHQNCGAVTAAIEGYDDPGQIHSLIEAIQPAVEEAKALDGDRLLNAIHCNAKRVARLLLRQEPVLSQAVQNGQLRIVPAYYRLDTGHVDLLEI